MSDSSINVTRMLAFTVASNLGKSSSIKSRFSMLMKSSEVTSCLQTYRSQPNHFNQCLKFHLKQYLLWYSICYFHPYLFSTLE